MFNTNNFKMGIMHLLCRHLVKYIVFYEMCPRRSCYDKKLFKVSYVRLVLLDNLLLALFRHLFHARKVNHLQDSNNFTIILIV